MKASVLLLALGLALVGIAAAPAASACGFHEEWHVGPVEAGLDCTRPYVEAFGERVAPLGP